MKNPQPSLMVHTNPEFATSNLILDFEFDQQLESHKHVINIIMGFRDMRCYKHAHYQIDSNLANQSSSDSPGF
jgi:ferritin